MIKVAHISTGLETGGAEVQLLRLLNAFNKKKFEMMVIGLDRDSYLGERMRELGIPVHALNVKKNPRALFHAHTLLKAFNPDVIHGTMYEGGVVASLFRRFLPKKPPVIWTSHEPLEHYDKEPLRKRLQLRLWGMLSTMPECMMYVSDRNKEQHLDWGFNNDKARVIPNGVDTTRFAPNKAAGRKIRTALGIPNNAFVIGKIARYHRQKNHIGFLQSAALLNKTHPKVHYVLVGTNVDHANTTLTALIDELGLTGKVHLLGNREDIPNVVNAFDLATLTSFGEAFPLTLGEAMVSAVPCVATDVGDNRFIIGDTGLVTPTRDDQAMANAWKDMLEKNHQAFNLLGQAARERALTHFTLAMQVQQHERLYESLHQQHQNPASLKKFAKQRT